MRANSSLTDQLLNELHVSRLVCVCVCLCVWVLYIEVNRSNPVARFFEFFFYNQDHELNVSLFVRTFIRLFLFLFLLQQLHTNHMKTIDAKESFYLVFMAHEWQKIE